jgi:hypothetical protein
MIHPGRQTIRTMNGCFAPPSSLQSTAKLTECQLCDLDTRGTVPQGTAFRFKAIAVCNGAKCLNYKRNLSGLAWDVNRHKELKNKSAFDGGLPLVSPVLPDFFR